MWWHRFTGHRIRLHAYLTRPHYTCSCGKEWAL